MGKARDQILERPVLEASGLIEAVVADVAEISLRLLHHRHVEKHAGLTDLVVGAEPADAAGRGGDDRGGFLVPHALPVGTRTDVDRVLQHAWNAAIIFRRHEQNAVGRANLLAKAKILLGLLGKRIEVLVVEGQIADLDHRAVEVVAPQRADRAGDLAVDAAFAKAADDDRDLVGHGASPWTKGKSLSVRKVARIRLKPRSPGQALDNPHD